MYYVPIWDSDGDMELLRLVRYKALNQAISEAISNIERHKKNLNTIVIYGSDMRSKGFVTKEKGGTYEWFGYKPSGLDTYPLVRLKKDGTPKKTPTKRTARGRR